MVANIFLLFIDDCSRMMWVYFLKAKCDTFFIFRTFKGFVEKESGCFIKTLQANRGDEFTSKEFSILQKYRYL